MLANGPGFRHDPLADDGEGDLAFQDVEALLLPAVDVRGRTAARRDKSLPQGVLAVGVVAGRQEAVHVTDDGDGAPLGRAVDDGIAGHASFLGCGPFFNRLTARRRWRIRQPPAWPSRRYPYFSIRGRLPPSNVPSPSRFWR
jgi:hypothetical protein